MATMVTNSDGEEEEGPYRFIYGIDFWTSGLDSTGVIDDGRHVLGRIGRHRHNRSFLFRRRFYVEEEGGISTSDCRNVSPLCRHLLGMGMDAGDRGF